MTDDLEGFPVFQLPDGRLVVPSRQHVAGLYEEGDVVTAYALMRYQLESEARRLLRRRGCTFRRSQRLAEVDPDAMLTDHPEGIAALVDDATEFVGDLGEGDQTALEALAILRRLHWQTLIIDAAPTEEAKAVLRDLAVVSSSLGLASARLGIEGAIPSTAQLEAELLKQKRGREEGIAQLRAQAEMWREPLRDWTQRELARLKPKARHHGMVVQYKKRFRLNNPNIELPGSNGPDTFISGLINDYLIGQGLTHS